MFKPDSITMRMCSLSNMANPYASESAAGFWTTYLGNKPVDLEGGEAEIQTDERYSFEYKRNWIVSFREGKELYVVKSPNPFISARILFQSRIPKQKRFNINNAGVAARGIKLEVFSVAKTELRNDDWYVPKGAELYVDQHGNYYLDVDTRTPIAKMETWTKKARASILTLFRKQGQEPVETKPVVTEPKPKPKPKLGQESLLPDSQTPLDDLGTLPEPEGFRPATRKQTTYLVAFPTVRDESVVVTPAPTLRSCNRIALDLANNKKLDVLGANYTIYKIDESNKAMRELLPATILLKRKVQALPVYKVQRVIFDIRMANYAEPSTNFAAIDDPDFAICSQNLDQFNKWIEQQAKQNGYFTKSLKPRAHQEEHCLVFKIVSGGLERERMRLEIKAFCIQVMNYLRNYQALDGIKVKQRKGKTVALVEFTLPTLSDAQLQSSSLLKAKPPTLNAPIYYVKDQPQSVVSVIRTNLNTGEVTVNPVRRQGFGDDPAIPRVNLGNLGVQTQAKWIQRTVPYTQLEKLTMK